MDEQTIRLPVAERLEHRNAPVRRHGAARNEEGMK